MGRLDRIYEKLPVLGQHAAVSAYGLYWKLLRFGPGITSPGYRQHVRDYRARDRFTSDQWQEWQHLRLKAFLSGALNSPYYAETWDAGQQAAAEEGRLDELPLLEKGPLRDNLTQFLRRDMNPKFRMVSRTSGSTGTPIENHWTWSEVRNSRAVREVRSAGWAGVSFAESRATFSGRFVEPNPESSGPFHRFNLAEKQVYFSAFHLRPETAHQYVEALRTHKTRWLTGYAVSYYLLADLILEMDLEVPDTLQAVITTSEKLTPEMRDVMERAYRCRIYEEYSTVENCLFASECEHGSLHISPDVSVVEILRPDGSPCEPEEPGEVVTTCLMRDYQPFIRYRVGDVAAWSAEPCSCGRQMPVLKEVVGRLEDVVIGSDGRRLVRFHGVFVDQPHVREGQIVQETLDRIRVKVVPSDGFGADDIADLEARVKARVGDLQVIVEAVDEIPRTKAGKFKAVINLALDEANQVKEVAQHVAG